MKRLLAIVLVAAMLLCGCAAGPGQTYVDSYKYNFYISGGAEGEGCFSLAAAFTELENKTYADINLLQRTNGDDASNIAAVNGGTLDIAIVRSDALEAADGADKVYALAALYKENIQIITKSGSGIDGIADIAGKKAAVCSSDEELLAKLLGAAGVDAGTLDIINCGRDDAIQKITSGEADAALVVGDDMRSAIEGAISTLAFVPLGEDAINKLLEENACFTKADMPIGEYKGLAEAYATVAVNPVVIAGSSVGEDAAYNIVKTLFDNQSAFTGVFPKAAGISAAAGADGVSVGFHAGAKKFFAEKQIALPE